MDIVQIYFAEVLSNPLVRLSGLLAMASYVIALGLKIEDRVKLMLCFVNLFLAIHFYSLDSAAGVAISLIGLAHLSCALNLPALSLRFSIKADALNHAFSALYVLGMFITYKSPIDLFATGAVLLGNWALFSWKGVPLRWALMLSAMMWIVYDFSVGAYEVGVSSCFAFLVSAYALQREYRTRSAPPAI